MKQGVRLLIVCMLVLSLCACRGALPSDTASGTTDSPVQSSATESSATGATENNATEATENTKPDSSAQSDVMNFYFSSGVGAWYTHLELHADGSFIGSYSDSDMGSNNDAYPYGTRYICSFSGIFENIEKIDEHSYKLTLAYVNTEKPVGEEWIEDGVRHIASGPHGIDEGTDFILYLPDTPIHTLSQDFLLWWPYRYDHQNNPKDTLSCYGILNVTTGQGFFQYETKQA